MRRLFLFAAGILLCISLVAQVSVAQVSEHNYGGTLRVQYMWNPKILNPMISTGGSTTAVTSQVYEKLITYDGKIRIAYKLATSYEFSPDHKTITFHLRKGVKWHDGVPFTSADVKWCFDNIVMKLPTSVRIMFEGFGKVTCTAPDDYTVVFTAGVPLMDYLFAYTFSIMPKHIYEGAPEKNWTENPANMKPIGTGPWKIQEFVVGDHITFVANEDYYLGRPYIDKMIWKIITKAEMALLAFDAGEVDLVFGWTGRDLVNDIPRLRTTPGVRVYSWNYWASSKLMFNFRDEAIARSPWLKDVRVRRAFAYALDVPLIVERCMGDWTAVDPGHYPKPPFAASWAYNPNVPKYPYDPVKAEKLLDEAGYKRGADGVRMRVETAFCPGEVNTYVMEALKDYLHKVGIELDVTAYDESTMDAKFTKNPEGFHNIPLAFHMQAAGPHPDMLSRIYQSFNTLDKGGWNYVWYKNPEVDSLLASARVEVNETRQIEMYKRVQYILCEDVAAIPLYLTPQVEIWNADFDRSPDSMTPLYGCNPFYQVWWLKATAPIRTTTTAAPPPTEPMQQYVVPIAIMVPVALIVATAYLYLRKKRRPP